jgi:hypothetical protein
MPYNSSMTALMDLEMADVAGAELREADRFPMRSPVRVCPLEDCGTARAVPAQGLNISAKGMAFLASEALAPGMRIHLALPHTGLSARARVRNCERRERGWRVGVEIEGSLAQLTVPIPYGVTKISARV